MPYVFGVLTRQLTAGVGVQDESGAFAPILASKELEAMYSRILEQEIPQPNAPSSAKKTADSAGQRRGVQASRLAAALGLSHLFRCACVLRNDFPRRRE